MKIHVGIMSMLLCTMMAGDSHPRSMPNIRNQHMHDKHTEQRDTTKKSKKDDEQEEREKQKKKENRTRENHFWNGVSEGAGRAVGEVGVEGFFRLIIFCFENPKFGLWLSKNVATAVLAAKLAPGGMGFDKVVGFVLTNMTGEGLIHLFRSSNSSALEIAATSSAGSAVAHGTYGWYINTLNKNSFRNDLIDLSASIFAARLTIEGACKIYEKLSEKNPREETQNR
jgi:hypothetical protein